MKSSSPRSLFVYLLPLFFLPSPANGRDTIGPTEVLRDGDTLVSANVRFVLGFFSPRGSTKKYLGIWFSVSPETVVWVANRDNPIDDSSGTLLFDTDGMLVLANNNSQTLWSPGKKTLNATAQLNDTGNFILKGKDSTDFLWQSFDFPTDTLLPEMKLGPDKINNLTRSLTSWTNQSDPSSGQYTYKMDDRGEAIQPYVVRKDGTITFRSGPWNGIEFSGHNRMSLFQDLRFRAFQNANETYYQYWTTEESTLARLVMEPSGYLTRYGWDGESKEWKLRWSAPDDSVCDNYGQCGPNAVCNSGSSALCRCLAGFQPKRAQDWRNQIWRDGCVRSTNLTCNGDGDGFLPKNRMKLPDTNNAVVDRNMSFDLCGEACLSKCSCVAYSSADINGGGSGCILWFGELVDMRNFSDGGQDMYLKLEIGDLRKSPSSPHFSNDRRKLSFLNDLLRPRSELFTMY